MHERPNRDVRCAPNCSIFLFFFFYTRLLSYFILSLHRHTPLNSMHSCSLHFLSSSLLAFLPSFLPLSFSSPSSLFVLFITPTPLHHSLISSHISQSISLRLQILCFSSVRFHSRPATERSRSRLILCLDTTSQLILNSLLGLVFTPRGFCCCLC